MSRLQGKSRPSGASGMSRFGSSVARGGFGGFSSSRLSYLTEPLDFSKITDPNVIVSFKNLLKKDSTTKAKALEDLVAYVQAHPYEKDGGAEEAILETWVQSYPRISIDNSRRVRELSHLLQLELMKSARKRMEKRIPKAVGAWLAGTFDKDRAVSRAANDGLSSFLNTDEKVLQLWRRCQQQILEYATEAVKETPDSLSDERSTTKDDADAKYFRVMGASLLLVVGLLQKLDGAETEKLRDEYDTFFAVDSVWASATAPDPFVRKAVYELLLLCLDKRAGALRSQLPRLGKIMASDALKSNQTGSALEYVAVLAQLTARHPEIWGEKKHPFSRLRPLLEKGSQGSSPSAISSFWRRLDQLFESMPRKPISADEAMGVAKSLRIGISGRDEPRSSAVDAWTVYLSTARRLLDIITPEDTRVRFVEENVFPLIEHYMYPPPPTDKSLWATGALSSVISRAFVLLSRPAYPDIAKSVETLWAKLSADLASRMANSLPEVSEGFQASQKDIAREGSRWFSVVGEIHRGVGTSESAQSAGNLADELAKAPSVAVLEKALDLLQRRNYKPFGAASLLSSAFTYAPHIFEKDMESFVLSIFPVQEANDLNTLLSSPSSENLLSCLSAIGKIPGYADYYRSTFRAVAASLGERGYNDVALVCVTRLISDPTATSVARQDPTLQKYLRTACSECARGGNARAWELFEAVFTYDTLDQATSQAIAADVVGMLGDSKSNQESVLRALDLIAREKAELLLADESVHLDLVAKLLGAMETTDATSSAKIRALRALIDKPSGNEPPLVKVIQENLDTAGSASLEVDTLVEQAAVVSKAESVSLEHVFPSTNIWMTELLQFLQGGLNPALSLTSSIGGAYLLVSSKSTPRIQGVKRDRRGNSVPARMATYTTKILSSGIDFSALPKELQAELLYLLYLVAGLGSDQIAVQDDSSIWGKLSDPEVLSRAEDLVSSIHKVVNSLLAHNSQGTEIEQDSLLDALLDVMVQQTRRISPLAVYSSRALSELLQTVIESRGFTNAEEQRIAKLDLLKADPSSIMGALGIISGYGEMLASSKTLSNLLNRLVSDTAGAKPDAAKTLATLVLLNSSMSIYEVGELPVANNRLVFAVRQITSWFEEPESLDGRLAAESCRALQRLLPCVKDVYGPYWERTVEFCIALWGRAAHDDPHLRLPYVYSSLKLVTALEAIREPNDDLEDAIKSLAKEKSQGLIELLNLPRIGHSQPEELVESLLCRMVQHVPLDHIQDLSELYGLMASESREVQTAAFGLLHRALPAAQEQLSLDVLLEKRAAQLPDELLSLLLDSPTLESYPDDVLANFPTPIRSYLLSWHLVFDAFSTASFKVRNDYIENLKKANHVAPLMDFTFDVLGHSAAHPLNLDKEGLGTSEIKSYYIRLADAEVEEKNMHWLLVHLYYSTLKYIPGLFKAWYLDCRSKQTKIAVEAWTTKYFSPIIINETLDEVAEWANSQEPPADDEKELVVKVSKLAREVTAGYEVDELQASIAIRIPPSYPIDSVTVVGINRVAVNEKKWQNWIMATQGVIMFSNGSIIDGLAAFRRNVVGALKGQTECAICYSIVSTDKKMPDKRCGTCKNLFHRTCLYKWFQTSNQNSCPLCRNPIDYLGADTRVRRNRGFDD